LESFRKSTTDFSLGSSKRPKRPIVVGVATPLERSGNIIFSKLGHFEKNKFKTDLDRVGLVHRIDKDTSGLLVVAKNDSNIWRKWQ